MNNRFKKLICVLSASAVLSIPVYAEKPDSPGNSDHSSSSKKGSSNPTGDQNLNVLQHYFNTDRSTVINNYYSEARKSGKCPPGLAKKNNGCQPPGQAKKWRTGEYFPHGTPYHDLPSALLAELGRTPEGRKVIQVGTDILLISIATGRILDVLDLQD
jgi:Ni/Co efflux regulator RcnB